MPDDTISHTTKGGVTDVNTESNGIVAHHQQTRDILSLTFYLK